jgi:hypothetical protein
MRLEICECDCHIIGSDDPEHPCCILQGEKYINKDRTFDWVKVGHALRRHKAGGDYTDYEKRRKNRELNELIKQREMEVLRRSRIVDLELDGDDEKCNVED